MVMDRPLRKRNNECEWEKAEKIRNIESILLDMLIIYKFIVQSSHNNFYNVRNNLCGTTMNLVYLIGIQNDIHLISF